MHHQARLRGLLALLLLQLSLSFRAPPAVVKVPDGWFETDEKPNTYARKCRPSGSPMYPLDQDPYTWPTCDDAYDGSWRLDLRHYLDGFTEVEITKLARTHGFCPQHRCQLDSVGKAHGNGTCPAGLCFSKMEQGRATYGGCCFVNNAVNTHELIGYYDRLRQSPKPAYKRKRVVLGPDPAAETPETFINANEVFDGLIITQCPITDVNPELTETVGDFEQMLTEQDVGLVLQFEPFVKDAELLSDDQLFQAVTRRGCEAFVPKMPALRQQAKKKGKADGHGLVVERGDPMNKTVHYAYDLPIRSGPRKGQVQHVEHYWMHGWKDFQVPERPAVVLDLAQRAVDAVRSGKKVVVLCHAGRGRSGTMTAIIQGMLAGITKTSELVDLIVTMRESRDGVLENPGHVAYVRDMLGLVNTVPYKKGPPDAASPSLLSPATLWAWLADEHQRWRRRGGGFGAAWAHLLSFVCGAVALYAVQPVFRGSASDGGGMGLGKRLFSPPKAKGS